MRVSAPSLLVDVDGCTVLVGTTMCEKLSAMPTLRAAAGATAAHMLPLGSATYHSPHKPPVPAVVGTAGPCCLHLDHTIHDWRAIIGLQIPPIALPPHDLPATLNTKTLQLPHPIVLSRLTGEAHILLPARLSFDETAASVP